MLKRTEKTCFSIIPCKIDKKMFQDLGESLKGLDTRYMLESDEASIESDSAELFVGSDWPSSISAVKVAAADSEQKIEISMNFSRDQGEKIRGRVLVTGSDRIWVGGMAKQLQAIFMKYRVWYFPIARYWQIRMLTSLAVVSLVAWQFNRGLSRLVTQPLIGMTELQSFGISFLIMLCFLYPLYLGIGWLFPSFELERMTQKPVRKFFWFLLAVLIGWIITELLIPHILF